MSGAARVGLLSAGLGITSLARAQTAEPPASPEPAAEAAEAPAKEPAERAAEPYRFEEGVICPFCKITPEYPTGRRGLHWHTHWRTVGLPEYVSVPLLAAGVIGVELFGPDPSRPRWTSPILFDRSVRDLLRLESPKARRTASTISDAIFVVEVLHPAVVDPLLVAWWQRESPFTAWQMFVIDAQAYALTLLVSGVVKRATARERPWVRTGSCARNPEDKDCGTFEPPYQSFFSGHSAVTATGAGLICAHHTQLSLYQNDYLDSGTCVLAVLGTAMTGAMRIASDNHWVSDVLVGHATGYLSGYLLPTLLYYREFRAAPHDHEQPPGPAFATLPMITRDSVGLTVLGVF